MKKIISLALIFLLAKLIEIAPFYYEKLIGCFFFIFLFKILKLFNIPRYELETYVYSSYLTFEYISKWIYFLPFLFAFLSPMAIAFLTKSRKAATLYWLFSTLADLILFIWIASKPCHDDLFISSCAMGMIFLLIIVISGFILRSISYLIGRLIIRRKLASR